MIENINVKFHKIPKSKNFYEIEVEKLPIKKNSIVLLSKKCYLNICKYNFYFNNCNDGRTKFLLGSELSLSTKPVCNTNWYLLKTLYSKDYTYSFASIMPINILFVYYEDEFETKDVKAIFFTHTENESPIDFIMEDLPEFKNSMFFLTKRAYSALKKNTNLISSYKGIERFSWLPDVEYSGGNLVLNTISDNFLYFIESMSFTFFEKSFAIDGFPDTLYFII